MKCKCKDCGSILEMTEGVECPCPRCGYEHTTFEVSERIAAAKIEEAKKTPRKKVLPKSASLRTPSSLMHPRGVTFSPSSPFARRPASPYVDPFSSTSGKMKKGSSAKAAVLYGAAVVLGIAVVSLLATRIFQFASSRGEHSSPKRVRPEPGTKREPAQMPPRVSPPVGKPVLPRQTAPITREPPVEQWTQPKDWYERECANVEKVLERFQSGGYRMTGGSVSAGTVRDRVAAVRRCVRQNDPAGAQLAHENLLRDFNNYSEHCVWTKGLRHPKYAHIFSGQNPDVWEIEKGYQLVNPGTADWTVRKVPVEVVCGRCRGKRYISESGSCPICKGRKVFPVETAYSVQGQNFHPRVRGGRPPRRPLSIKAPCWNCGGKGSVPMQKECPKCKGRGTEFR